MGEGGAGDAVRFLLGANPGEPVQPLARVASGGELARTMLALRLVAVGRARPPWSSTRWTPGWAAQAALALARALREVAAGRQVLVVTHLAQVAAFADHQVAVEQGGAARVARSTGAAELGRRPTGWSSSPACSRATPTAPPRRAHAEELLAVGAGPGGVHHRPPPRSSSVEGCQPIVTACATSRDRSR